MADRKPLVLVGGRKAELPSGDKIPVSILSGFDTAVLSAMSGLYDPYGSAAAAVSAHVALADPHSQYLLSADATALYAPLTKGVTNGDAHDHLGGDGAQIAYSSLSGLPSLGSMAAQNASNVAITGGVISGMTSVSTGIDGYKIGSTTVLASDGTNHYLNSNGSLYQTVPAGYALYTTVNGVPITTISATGLAVTGALSATGTAQAALFNSPTGTYATWQHTGTSIGDVGTANQVISGGGATDFGISARNAKLVFATDNGINRGHFSANGLTVSGAVYADGAIRSAAGVGEAQIQLVTSTALTYLYHSYNGNSVGWYDSTAGRHLTRYNRTSGDWIFTANAVDSLQITDAAVNLINGEGTIQTVGSRAIMQSPSGDGRFAISGDSANYSSFQVFGSHGIGTEYAGEFHLRYNNNSKAKVTSSGFDVTGALSIGNSVSVAVAAQSTHKVAIPVGGTTYYFLASDV